MLLKITKVKKCYKGPVGLVQVLKEINLSLGAGETLALIGESGSGKSTLLHLIAGLDTIDSGSISINGMEVSDLDENSRSKLRRTKLSIIFQQFNLITSLNVAANINFQALISGKHDSKYVHKLVQKLGLSDQMEKYPEQLSGGQQQRVAIARTLASKPNLILADEPTGNLDEETSGIVLREMLALVRETKAGLILVTHSPKLASYMNRKLRLSEGILT